MINDKSYNMALPFFEKKEIKNVLKEYKNILEGKGLLSMGVNVEKFENEFSKYIGCKFANVTSSCTGALELTLNALNISEGDEVIVPCQTFFGTASAVVRNKLKLKFCNIDENFSIDYENLKKLVTKKTKAIIVVHFAGLIQKNIFEIKKFCKKKNIFLIEDCAHAIGASIKGIKAGNIGDAGCFSFYSTKNLTTGEGGMITSNNKKFSKLTKSLRSRGININSKNEIFTNIGTNLRVTEFQAILGRIQLKRINKIVQHRNLLVKTYNNQLKDLKKNDKDFFSIKLNEKNNEKNIHAYWRYILKFNYNINRLKLKKNLKKFNINIDWPYVPLLHKQPALKKYYKGKYLKQSEKLTKNFVCLPLHSGMNLKDIFYISKKLSNVLKNEI